MNETQKLNLEAINQTLELIKGKWKVPIITSLSILGKTRFSNLLNIVDGIGSKMLSKELKDLETNKLIKRTVIDTKPVIIEYELTLYGKTLETILFEMSKWGTIHKNQISGKNSNAEIDHFLIFDI